AAYRSGALTGKVTPSEIGGVIAAANDYGDVYDLLYFTPEGDRDAYGVIEKDASGSPEAVDYEVNTSESAPVDRNGLAISGDGYSKTNVQVDGIDEADVVKTDGKYIYAVSYVNVYILSAENGELETVAKIPYREQDGSVFSPDPTLSVPWDTPDIYIDGDRLVVAANTYRADEENGADVNYYWYMPYFGHSFFTAAVYDIADRTAPTLISTVSVSGDGVSSRLTDGKLYLVAADRYYGEPDRDDPESYIPSVYKNGEAELVSPGAIYCGSEESACEYLNVMEISVSDASVVSSLSLLGYDGEIMYQSADSIYAARTDYKDEETRTEQDGITTEVYKCDYGTVLVRINADGELSFAGSAYLDGSVHNSFSMDEYGGYLRVVTSVSHETYVSKWRLNEQNSEPSDTDVVYYGAGVGDCDAGNYGVIDYDDPYPYYDPIEYISEDWNDDMYNNLYVLDSSMNVTGKLEGLAPDERIYSCRFEGADGYFVTYRETDPLFHVDLSDPTAPRVIDELKLPGHSDYLESFGDLLFGFGADDEGYLKLSMFKEDENGAMSEISTLPIPGAYYSEVAYDHHAILADAGRGIICFGAATWDENDNIPSKFYIVYWNGQSFEIKMAANVADWSGAEAIRSLYIGDFIYLYVRGNYSGNSLSSFSLSTYETVD
ncbi:MAG: beta-propeller domain-containing protein, partial [Clostridia bacterium]|nr:beta-propeller domain-containing protein [Clostridia bacterium]